MNLNLLNVLSLTQNALGTVGTSGTSSNGAGFCVPVANLISGNTGYETGDTGAETTKCSPLVPGLVRHSGNRDSQYLRGCSQCSHCSRGN
jgi:hypothetical protein